MIVIAVEYCFDGNTHVVSENDDSFMISVKKTGMTNIETNFSKDMLIT